MFISTKLDSMFKCLYLHSCKQHLHSSLHKILSPFICFSFLFNSISLGAARLSPPPPPPFFFMIDYDREFDAN